MMQESRTAGAMYNTEHSLAWLMALGAITLAVIGALISFDVFSIGGVGTEEGESAAARNFQEAAIWLLPAIGAALLAFTLHATQHHRGLGTRMDPRDMQSGARDIPQRDVNRGNQALWGTEHAMAYLAALAAIVLGAMTVLVGYDVFNNNNTWRDGVTWGLLAITIGVLAATLHQVGHHVPEEDEIRILVEQHVVQAFDRASGAAGAPRPAPDVNPPLR
jgi:hypothetical protein